MTPEDKLMALCDAYADKRGLYEEEQAFLSDIENARAVLLAAVRDVCRDAEQLQRDFTYMKQQRDALSRDAKRYRWISGRFDETKSSRCRNMLEALSIDYEDGQECGDLHPLIDAAMKENHV